MKVPRLFSPITLDEIQLSRAPCKVYICLEDYRLELEEGLELQNWPEGKDCIEVLTVDDLDKYVESQKGSGIKGIRLGDGVKRDLSAYEACWVSSNGIQRTGERYQSGSGLDCQDMRMSMSTISVESPVVSVERESLLGDEAQDRMREGGERGGRAAAFCRKILCCFGGTSNNMD